MTEAYRIGVYATDSLAGKVPRMLPTLYTAFDSGTVALCRGVNGNYTVPAGKTLTITGIMILGAAAWKPSAYLTLRYADDVTLTTNSVNLSELPIWPYYTYSPVLPLVLPSAVPAGKYVGLYNGSGVNEAGQTLAVVFGYES